ncbi:MAG: OmpA family protein [Acidiferrobacterales bacterium]
MKALVIVLGLIALGLFCYFCLRAQAPAIQNDLIARTTTALAADGMDWASVSADGRELRLTGIAPTQKRRKQADEVARGIWGANTVDNQITVAAAVPTPSLYRTALRYGDTGVVLTGLAPDTASRAWLVSTAEQRFGADRVEDRLEVASGAPEGWRMAMESALGQLDQFDEATATLVDNRLSVQGQTSSAAVRENVQQTMNAALPASFATHYDITVVEQDLVAICQQELNDLLADRQVLFDTDSADIRSDSFALLDELVAVVARCPDAQLEVVGHTDSRGSEDFNQWLSQARAKSVADYLASKGVSSERLSSVGYGPWQPIADNDTPAGRAKNRRIEFAVKGN